MTRCDQCETLLLFGGKRARGLRCCSQGCLDRGIRLLEAAERLDPLVPAALAACRSGRCPLCAGPGPVDVHATHFAYSLVFYTAWKSEDSVCCRSCGWHLQLGALIRCTLLGWWGFPLGLLITPLQIGRNLLGLLRPPRPGCPSAALERHVRQQRLEESLHPETARGWRQRAREEREAKALRGALSPEERLSVMLENLLEFERMAARRSAAVHLDGRSLRIAAAAITIPLLTLLAAELAPEPASSGILWLSRLSIPPLLALLAHALATDATRFVRTKLCGPIAQALEPFRPSAYDVEQLLSSMRAGDWELGRRLRSTGLQNELRKRE